MTAAQTIIGSGVVAILRLRDHGQSVEIGHTLVDAGLPVMEVTLDHPDAFEVIAAMSEALSDHAVVGAGTVRTLDQVRQASAAGARFCVSPNTDRDVIQATLTAGLEPLPGAATATEIVEALDAGARLVKLFPAGALGIGYLQALLGPFAGASLIPTGGIRHDEVGRWIASGAVAVGLGSDLVPSVPTPGDLAGIGDRARVAVAQAAAARDGRA